MTTFRNTIKKKKANTCKDIFWNYSFVTIGKIAKIHFKHMYF